MQAEEREPDPVQVGKRDGRGGTAVASQGLLRLAAAVVRESGTNRGSTAAGGTARAMPGLAAPCAAADGTAPIGL